MKTIYAYAINIIAIGFTSVVALLHLDKFSLLAMGYVLAFISPYLMSIFLVRRSKNTLSLILVSILSFILSLGAIFLIIDAIYINSDAQGAIVFPMVAIYQWAIILISLIPFFAMNRGNKR